MKSTEKLDCMGVMISSSNSPEGLKVMYTTWRSGPIIRQNIKVDENRMSRNKKMFEFYGSCNGIKCSGQIFDTEFLLFIYENSRG